MKIDFSKLEKEKGVRFIEIKPDTRYLILISKSNIQYNDLKTIAKNPLFDKSLLWVVDGEPDEVMAIYEIKDKTE